MVRGILLQPCKEYLTTRKGKMESDNCFEQTTAVKALDCKCSGMKTNSTAAIWVWNCMF